MLVGNAIFLLVQPKIIDFFKLQRSIDVSQILNLFKLIIGLENLIGWIGLVLVWIYILFRVYSSRAYYDKWLCISCFYSQSQIILF